MNSVINKISEIYLYFIIIIFPLVFSTDGYLNIFETKFVVFLIPTLVYLFATLVFCIIKKYKPCFDTAHYFVFAYALITTISALLSEHFPRTLMGVSRREGLCTILLYCAVFICISLFGTIKKSHVWSLIVTNTVFGIICLLQILGYNPFYLYPNGLNFYDGGVRYSGSYIGTIGNADLVGAYFCIVIPILFFVLIKSRLKYRFTAIIPLILLLYTVLKMSVTACVLGLVSGVIFAIPILINFKKRGVIIYASTVLLFGVMSLATLKCVDIREGFLHEIHEIMNGNVSASFGSNRIRIWEDVLSVIPEALTIGKGPDTMLLENFEKFSTFYPELNKTLTTSIDTAHNEYLNILYHQGILGLVSYLGILFITFVKFIKKPSGIGISAISYSVQAFFGISMCLTAPYFWIIIALINKASELSEALSLP